jgi:hypothetical protein
MMMYLFFCILKYIIFIRMNQPNDTRLSYDSCSYMEKLKRTIGPGLYALNAPYNDCTHCGTTLPDDPSMRYQAYGPGTCTMQTAVDDSSELLGLNYKKSKCNADAYTPGKYTSKNPCAINVGNPRQCMAPREDTRLSNPPCTLRGTGINRWEWLCHDPQDNALEAFDRVPVNYRMIAKDNHVPVIDTPEDQSVFFPKSTGKQPEDDINNWQHGTAQDAFAPGYPYGSFNYNVKCSS